MSDTGANTISVIFTVIRYKLLSKYRIEVLYWFLRITIPICSHITVPTDPVVCVAVLLFSLTEALQVRRPERFFNRCHSLLSIQLLFRLQIYLYIVF